MGKYCKNNRLYVFVMRTANPGSPQSATMVATMKPSTPKKPVVATLLALLPLDEVEDAEGADELVVLLEVALEHETFDGTVKLFDSVRSEHCTDGGQCTE